MPTALSHHVPDGRRGYRAALLVSFCLALLSMGAGLFTDDYLHFTTLAGGNTPGSPLDIYNFGDGNPEAMVEHMATGPHPWFALPEFKLHFFRPLSSLTMWVDQAVFGRWIPGYHLHSGLWYVALAVVIMLLLRRILPGPVGALALMLFVLDEGHLVPVGWWANRNALVATVPALLGLLAHIAWQEEGWRPGLRWSLLGYVLGFLGGETALGIMAYLGAYELFGAPGRLPRRIKALIPAVALSLAYLAFYSAAGYGTFGSEEYINPLSEWRIFLAVAPERLMLMAGNLILGIPPEANIPGVPSWLPGIVGLALLVSVVALIMRTLPDHERRAVRWLLVGACIAGIPTLSASPSARLYILPSIGSAAVLAIVLRHGWRVARCWRNAGWKLLTAYLAFVHLVLSALLWPAAIVFSAIVTGETTKAIQAFGAGSDVGGRQAIVLSSSDTLQSIYTPFMMAYHGFAPPATWWCSTLAAYEKRVTRVSSDTLVVDLLDRSLLSRSFEAVMRRRDLPLHEGDVVRTVGMEVVVLETDEKGVRSFSMQFDASLDDDRYRLVVWDRDDKHFTTSPVPAVGETIHIPN